MHSKQLIIELNTKPRILASLKVAWDMVEIKILHFKKSDSNPDSSINLFLNLLGS